MTVKAHSDYAEVNGTKLYYEIAGEGRTIIFTHAGVADSRMWDGQFPVFAEHYRVIRWDMRGYGQSQPPEGEFTFAHRDDLYGLLQFLGVERAVLVGCSMGGGASMDVVLEHPELAAALVMVGSGPGGLALDVPAPAKFLELEKAAEAKDRERILELEAQIWFDGQGRTPDQVNQAARAKMLEMNGRAFELNPRLAGKRRPPMTPSAAERLSDLDLPVLIIYGDQDLPYMQAAAQHMSDHIQGAKKVLMPDTAHLPNMEKPDIFNALLLDFLQSIP